MKNACILLKNSKSAFTDNDYLSAVNTFRTGGYAFDELRILYRADEKRFTDTLTSCKADFDNILLLADAAQILGVKSLVLPIFSEELQGAANGAGVYAHDKKTLFLIPVDNGEVGVEFIKTVCLPYLARKYGKRVDKFVIRAVGANEMRVEQLIARAESLSQGKMNVAHTKSYDEDVLEVFYDETAPKMLTDDVLRVFAEGLEDTVYALNDTNLETQLVQLLKLRGRKISVAESFTGGGIARRIVSVPGASEVYFEGLNTYNELSKIKRLGVSEYTLKTVGAVSDETAYEMAAGLIATGDCDISIATTGLAGPNTDKSMLPVGLCYIAVGTQERVYVYRYKFDGNRKEITEKAINYALFLAYKQLKNM